MTSVSAIYNDHGVYGAPLATSRQEAAKSAPESKAAASGGDTAVISPKAYLLADIFGQDRFSRSLAGATADGTTVSVSRANLLSEEGVSPEEYLYSANLTGKDGYVLSLDFTGNAQVGKTADGLYAAYFEDTNMTRMYAADGTYTESKGCALDPDGGSIYLSTRPGAVITTGNGDNLIFVYGDNTTVTGGSGNDAVVLAPGGKGHSINTGEGNDSVIGKDIADSTIELGAGDNTLSLDKVVNSAISAGDGNNTVTTKGMDGGTLTLGDGNNMLRMSGVYGGALVALGDGNNTAFIDSVGQDNPWLGRWSSGDVRLGNGNNTVVMYKIWQASTFSLGNGDNKMDIHSIVQDAALNLGDGNNRLTAFLLAESASLTAGNGNNDIGVFDIGGQASLTVGNGDNTVSLHVAQGSAAVRLGDGGNTLQIYEVRGQAGVRLGHGNNRAALGWLRDDAAVEFGDGHNAVQIQEMKDRAAASLGDGDNALLAFKVTDAATLRFGHGNNLLGCGMLSTTSSVSFGSGENHVFAKEKPRGPVRFKSGDDEGDGKSESEIAVVGDMGEGNCRDKLEKLQEDRKKRLGLDQPLPKSLEQGFAALGGMDAPPFSFQNYRDWSESAWANWSKIPQLAARKSAYFAA